MGPSLSLCGGSVRWALVPMQAALLWVFGELPGKQTIAQVHSSARSAARTAKTVGPSVFTHTSPVFQGSNARHRRAPNSKLDFLCYNKTGLERRGRRSRRPLSTREGAHTSLCSTSFVLT